MAKSRAEVAKSKAALDEAWAQAWTAAEAADKAWSKAWAAWAEAATAAKAGGRVACKGRKPWAAVWAMKVKGDEAQAKAWAAAWAAVRSYEVYQTHRRVDGTRLWGVYSEPGSDLVKGGFVSRARARRRAAELNATLSGGCSGLYFRDTVSRGKP